MALNNHNHAIEIIRAVICQKQIYVEGDGHCCHRPSSNWETDQFTLLSHILIGQLQSLTSFHDIALIKTNAYNTMKEESCSVHTTPSNGVKTERYNITNVQF